MTRGVLPWQSLGLFDEQQYKKNLRRRTLLRNRPITACCISPSNKLVISGTASGVLETYDLVNSYARPTNATTTTHSTSSIHSASYIHAQDGCIYCLVSDDQRGLLWLGGDRDLRCFHWDYLDAHLPHGEHHVEVVEKISLGCGETNGIAIHPAHNTIIVAGGDTKAYLYDYEYSKVVGALKGHEEYLHDVILDKKSGSLVATCSEDCTLRLWDLRNHQCIRIFDRKRKHRHSSSKRFVTSALFDNDSDFLLMGDGAKNLSIGYVGTGEVVHSISLTGIPSRIRAYEENVLLSCFDDSVVRLFTWRLNSVAEAKGCNKSVFDLAVSNDESMFVSCGTSDLLDVYIRSFVSSMRLRSQSQYLGS
jgi:WD40 repeat protein